ncbi:MAG: transposase [Blastocatellia bacterium]|nr:transposase [Blastocatellia bacterium]
MRLTYPNPLCRIGFIVKMYKFKLKPSPKIENIFNNWLDVCRELYNAALQERRDAYKINGTSINYHAQAAQLPEIKALRPDVARVNAQVLQDCLRKLGKAFDAFFRRVKAGEKPGYPRFKSRNRFNSFTFPQAKGAFSIKGDKLHLSKIGKVKILQHRPIEGEIKTCTIIKQADGWFACFAVEENQSRWFPKTGRVAGVDLNVSNFATLSTGEVIDNPRYLKEAERDLKIAQRKVSKKKKGGKNRKKAVALLAKKHLKVANQRKDFHHKLSLQLIREFDTTIFEDLNIKGLLKNHHLAKAISDVAWGSFLSIHFGKAESAGREMLKVAPHFTTQECSRCGNRVKMSLAIREYRCIVCGLVLPRDHNSALTVKGRAFPAARVKDTSPDDPRTYRATDPEAVCL